MTMMEMTGTCYTEVLWPDKPGRVSPLHGA